ncbi:Glutathione S-transferase omega-like 2 [Wickerhamomyces ciferrii]|uniref:Glutathione S-transferase omega-like 2 n=1 Tax=Wickerhamomyces ciferrii (strain ATCC 14091 / BCRC 22168 / CBS 111 / JCM 3599 / NBRC 0793 / NRRL Y-1031 F-60-10) TaxID=1206466 RepID=K0KW25_WICCF|nr:Glutathione S-transferase omega-like 2 [Wickerhamomyces ciferrii]CCH45704.1 Glutathione S-transferase omega-like 2 [Wickerhamomyces ciferrii]
MSQAVSEIAKQGGKNILNFASKDGSFKRQASVFRDAITRDSDKFKPEAGRYHVYISLACPWAHRVFIYLVTKGLVKGFNPKTSEISKDSIIGLSVVHWSMDEKGWRFPSEGDTTPAATQDHNYGFKRLSELYYKANPEYDGRFTVPVVWDKKTQTIVNNESAEIIRFLNTEFNDLIDDPEQKQLDYYPKELQSKIDELNSWIYDNINNAVYKSGFATKQEVYESEVTNLFVHLDKVEKILKENKAKGLRYLIGNKITEADIRLFTTIIRFDPVYVQHFKCNIGTIRSDYPYLHDWVRDLYWNNEEIKNTVNFDHIKFHYTKSHIGINPHKITPLGPIPHILPLNK